MWLLIGVWQLLRGILLGVAATVIILAPISVIFWGAHLFLLKYFARREIQRASDPHTPPEELLRLAQIPNLFIWRALAQNPNATIETLLKVAPKRPKDFLKNPLFGRWLSEDPKTLWNFALDKKSKKFWMYPNIPRQLMEKAVQHINPEIRELMCKNRGLPLSLRLLLIQDYQETIAQLASQQLTLREIYQLSRSEEDWKRAIAVSLERCFWFESFIKDPSFLVRLAVIRNPRVKPATLVTLSNDPEMQVRAAVASHPKTPNAVASRLKQDPEIQAEITLSS